jgi:hypothetical protein
VSNNLLKSSNISTDRKIGSYKIGCMSGIVDVGMSGDFLDQLSIYTNLVANVAMVHDSYISDQFI